jgi:hypothetical protein
MFAFLTQEPRKRIHQHLARPEACRNNLPQLTCTEPTRVLDLTSLDLGMQSGHALIVERDFATNEHVQDDTERPYIDFWPNVRFRVE